MNCGHVEPGRRSSSLITLKATADDTLQALAAETLAVVKYLESDRLLVMLWQGDMKVPCFDQNYHDT